ncbi:MAG: CHAT domain-containing protein [Jiangellaceae bacterium]
MSTADLNDDLELAAIWIALHDATESRRFYAARILARHDVKSHVRDVQRLVDQEPSGRVRFWLSVALAKAGFWSELTWANWDRIDLGDPATLAGDIRACGPFPPGAMEAIRDTAERSWVFAAFLRSVDAHIPAGDTAATPDDGDDTPDFEPTGSAPRGVGSSGETELPDFGAEAAVDEPPEPETATRQAYPRVDAPDVVVVDHPFDVIVGVAPRRDRTLVGTGGFDLTGDEVRLEVLLTYDPQSLRLDGDSRLSLPVTRDDPYPSATVRFTALDGDDLGNERRIGVHYLLDGVVRAIAWRVVVAVLTPDEVAGAPKPQTRERELLDLTSLVAEDAPDLVLAVFRADSAAPGHYVWAAYPSAAGVTVPDSKRARSLGDPRSYTTDIGREVAMSNDRYALYAFLVGTGRTIGDAVPPAIQAAIREVAQRPDPAEAASVLLLTEEPYVPWELAAFTPPLATRFGGASPFLGAHVALGRWPLTESRPRPVPRRSVEVVDRAVLTATYVGVTGWPQLPFAEAEAAALAERYPRTAVVEPVFRDVLDCLGGQPATDVLHVALHGRFDPQGVDQGLVLLAPKANGGFGPQYLKPQHVDAVTMPRPTFLFLNACQVGQGQVTLGDYAGLAAALLRAGASGVVAALWNVEDEVASRVADEFYAAVYRGDDAPSVAETLRRIRANYTADNVDTGTSDSATFVAYQLFGHPRLRLLSGQGDDGG